MTLSRLVAISALALLPGMSQGQANKVDLTGKWAFSVTTDNGTGTPTITFRQTGDSLSGHYSSQVFGEVDFAGGKVKDGKINFSFTASVQGQSLTVTYSGTVESADSVKGTMDLGGFGSGTWTGTRQRP